MSTSNFISSIIAAGLLLSLLSCGNNRRSNSSMKSQDAMCSELDCLSSVNWKILLDGKSFPEKTRIDVNGTTVINECVSKQKFVVDRTTSPQSITLENYYVPKRGQLKIDVIDLGINCDSESTFFSDSDVEFEATKTNDTNEVLIRL